MTTAPAKLRREVFRTSRLLEFCSPKELVAQTGHDINDWPLVILKELVDNVLDACEEAAIAPDILITVSTITGELSVRDNGPGLPVRTVRAVLDYTVRASSREAYVSPTRGAQGNALKTICAMPFALDGDLGRIRIDAGGKSHRIAFSVDQLRQAPVISHEMIQIPTTRGTSFTLFWPNSALPGRIGRFGLDQALAIPDQRHSRVWVQPSEVGGNLYKSRFCLGQD